MSGAIVFLKELEERKKRRINSDKICIDDLEFKKTLDELKFTIENNQKQILKLSKIISEKGQGNDEALMKIFHSQFGVVFKMLKTIF